MDSQIDPRLTRYALGEMTDPDRAAFEQAMTDADRAEVDAIRAIGGTLSGALSLRRTGIPACPTPAGEADVSREGTACAAAERQTGMPVLRIRSRRVRWMLAAAASVAVVGLTAVVLSSHFTAARSSSQYAVLQSSNASSEPTAVGGKTFYREGQLEFVQAPFVGVGRDSVYSRRDEQAAASAPERTGVAYRQKAEPEGELRIATGQATPAPIAASVQQLPIAAAKSAFTVDRGAVNAAQEEVMARKPATDNFSRRLRDRDATSTESYAPIAENPFLDPHATPLSTFGVDVDTASYANVRRFLTSGHKPPADAVRIEELINYFPTSDAPPTDGKPFAIHADVARCPWSASHDLVRVALKAKEVAVDQRPASNLVFLIDVSGSMDEPDKLPLVKRGLERLVDQLNENDRVAIVVYAGNAGLVLPSTNASDKATIRAAIDHLEAGGSTNGGQGIELAYATAADHFVKGGANRVILCTDGDFNVGVTDRGSLVSMIAEKAKAGVFLSVFGFGTGNVKDDTMEGLADKGNGTYAYVDTDMEAHKVFVEQASGTLLTVAKDVKIQIEFNPATVKSYRLLGYENRLLAKEDFKNDLKDAGDMGAGHNVVALYEIERVRPGHFSDPVPDGLKYQRVAPTTSAPDANSDELLTLKVRYKAPDAPLEQGVSQLIEQPLMAGDRPIEQASADFQFDAAVAGFGMLLRDSSARGDVDWKQVLRLAQAGLGADVGGHRAEFLTLVERAAKSMK